VICKSVLIWPFECDASLVNLIFFILLSSGFVNTVFVGDPDKSSKCASCAVSEDGFADPFSVRSIKCESIFAFRKKMSEETKTRLVIQRMVLENFKSYANSIEIGPFHKVLIHTYIITTLNTLLHCSRLLQLLVRMEVGKAMSSMPFSLYSVSRPKRCGRRNFPV
jgi:hypothetical protein